MPSPLKPGPVLLAATSAVVGLALLVGFALALPTAVEQARLGRRHATDVLCRQALRPEPASPTLGPLPALAPDFTLADWAGRPVTLSSLRGRVVLVNFWATWCPTCVVEMPSMERLVRAEAGRPFTLLAVSVDDAWGAVRRFFAQGTPLTVLLDDKNTVPPRWGTSQFPESFLVDKTGQARFYVVSDRDWSTPTVRACLAAMEDE